MDSSPGAEAEIKRLQRRFQRERAARFEAESIAEEGLRRLFETNQQLLLLEAIADAANQAVSVADALESAAQSICQFTEWQVGHAFTVVGQGTGVHLLSTPIWRGVEDGPFRAFQQSTGLTDFDLGAGLPGRVLASGTPAWVADIARDPNFPRAAAAQQLGIRAAAAFPILLDGEVTAVLEFFADRTLEPDAVLLRLMAKIGTQLGRVVERNRAEDRLIHEAFHDHLTGLPNRALFADRLAEATAHSERKDLAVLFIDLDDFKRVNDTLGHRAGDNLIVQVVDRLKACLRQEDTLARMGGDEFTVLLGGESDAREAQLVAERLMAALEKPFAIDADEVSATASIGIAAGDLRQESADDLLLLADIAMYRAKSLGKGRFEIHDQVARGPATGGLPVGKMPTPRVA